MKKRIGKYFSRYKKKKTNKVRTPEEEKIIKDQISERLMKTIKKQQDQMRHHHTPGKF